MNTITRRDVIAYFMGAASATVVIAVFFGLFGVQMNRAFVPQPTFAVQPTFADQTTFRPEPTFLIEPSFTPTNTATPTDTPTPTRTPTNTPTPTSTKLVQTGVTFGQAISIGRDGPSDTQFSVAIWDENILYIYSSSSEKVEYSYGDDFIKAEPTAAYTSCTFQTASIKNVVINKCKVYVIGDHPMSFRAPGLVNDWQFFASALEGGTTQYTQFATPVPSATSTSTATQP